MQKFKNFILFRGWTATTKVAAVLMAAVFGFVFFLPALPAFLAGEPHGNGSLVPHFVALAVVPGFLFLFVHFATADKLKKTALKSLSVLGAAGAYGLLGYLGLAATGFSEHRRENSVVYFCVQNTQAETCQRWVGLDGGVVSRLPASLQDKVKAKLPPAAQ